MKKLPAILLLLTVKILSAQSSIWSLTYTPAVVQVPDIRYGAQVGAAYRLDSKLQLLTELTTSVGKPDNMATINSQYLRIKPELRYFFTSMESSAVGYCGVQLSYAHRQWTTTSSGSYYEKKLYSDSSVSYSSAVINSPFATLTAQVGGVVRLRNHFSFDFFMGLGAKSVFTNYTNIKNPELVESFRPRCKIMFSPDPAWLVNSQQWRFQMNMGVRVMYSL
ncbi:MAG: hypothetical protein RLZ05_713, partial [Bacteroidota bacterium]|jgi:hypothetical protein